MAKKPTQVPGAPAESTPQDSEQQAAPTGADGKELPNADDIDPTNISRSVLTKQGWVCPA